MILKVVAFLVTFILVWILVRALMAAVDLIGELPILGFFNHLGGAVVGAAAALVIVWLLFLIITLLYNNAIGQSCFEMIEKSSILTFLYDNNILITKLLFILRGIFDLEKSVLKIKYIFGGFRKQLELKKVQVVFFVHNAQRGRRGK